MADSSKIEWTDATWNPVTGCTKVSPGCDHCYAETFAERWRGTPGHHFENGFDVTLRPERVQQPLKWRKPRKVFVNSMSDLFHDDIPDEFIANVFATMAATPQHTYQVLTKRHGRMRSLLNRDDFAEQVLDWGRATMRREDSRPRAIHQEWPLPNVWLGVSVEDQKRADLRIPALLDTPAAVRFLSCEPLLGPVDLSRWLGVEYMDALEGYGEELGAALTGRVGPYGGLHWVIVGGESGPGARPVHPDWVRTLRDQCTAAGTAFFFKQFGAWVPESAWLHRDSAPAAFLDDEGRFRPLVNGKPTEAPMARGEAITVRQVGKGKAGRELDGRTWDEFPQAVTA